LTADKVVGTAKPKEEAKEGRTAWTFSTGDELTIQWESTASLTSLTFALNSQDTDSSVRQTFFTPLMNVCSGDLE